MFCFLLQYVQQHNLLMGYFVNLITMSVYLCSFLTSGAHTHTHTHTRTIFTVITQDVQSKNISMGAPEVEFICEVNEASSCNWVVNEDFSAQDIFVVSELMVSNILLKDSDAGVNDNTKITCIMRVPTGPATLLNGTRVKCLPLVATGNFGFLELPGNNTARMLLQGVLAYAYIY